jgi:hypothetical protein
VLVLCGVHELYRDPYAFIYPEDRPFDQLGNPQLRGNARQGLDRVPVPQGGRLGRDSQCADPGQTGDQGILHSGYEIGLLRITRDILKRQNGNGVGFEISFGEN